jgi:hypothetical protein
MNWTQDAVEKPQWWSRKETVTREGHIETVSEPRKKLWWVNQVHTKKPSGIPKMGDGHFNLSNTWIRVKTVMNVSLYPVNLKQSQDRFSPAEIPMPLQPLD